MRIKEERTADIAAEEKKDEGGETSPPDTTSSPKKDEPAVKEEQASGGVATASPPPRRKQKDSDEDESEEEEKETPKLEEETFHSNDAENDSKPSSTRPSRRARKSTPRGGVDFSMVEEPSKRRKTPIKKKSPKATPKHGERDQLLDEEGNPKLVVYAAPPRTPRNPRAHEPGNQKYMEMIQGYALEHHDSDTAGRRQITSHIRSQFIFREFDGTPTSDFDLMNRLTTRLHTAGKRAAGQRHAAKGGGKRKLRSCVESLPRAERRKPKPTAMAKASPASTTQPLGKRAKINPPQEFAPPAQRLTVYLGAGHHLKQGNTTYKTFLEARRGVVGKQQHDGKLDDVVEECLNYFSFVSPDEKVLDKEEVVKKITRDLGAKSSVAEKMSTELPLSSTVWSSTKPVVHLGLAKFHPKTAANLEYKKLLDTRLDDFIVGQRGSLEIVEECLTKFTFLSSDGMMVLEDDDAGEQICRDIDTCVSKKPPPTILLKQNVTPPKATVPQNSTKTKPKVNDAASQLMNRLPPSDLPTVIGGTGGSTNEGNKLYIEMADSRRVAFMRAKGNGDKATQDQIISDIVRSFRFVTKEGGILDDEEARTKIRKNISDQRILDAMLERKPKITTGTPITTPPPPPPPATAPLPVALPVVLEIPKESNLLAEYDSSAHFIEELSFHAITGEESSDFRQLEPLPPPMPLPKLPPPKKGRPKYSFYDKYSYVTEGHECRIVHVDCTGLNLILPDDKEFIGRLMQCNDIFVLFQGLCRGLSREKILMELRLSSSPEPFPKVRRYDKVVNQGGITEYIERDKMVGMTVDKFLEYLSVLDKGSKGSASAPDEFHFMDNVADEEVTIDPQTTVLYMTDVDMTDRLTIADDLYRRHFLFPEILPGGEWCMMHRVPKTSRPFMGPNLYVTPGGGYTQIHQDGHGTVDSGHTCVSGYNEIVITRRLPEQHKLKACSMMPSREHVSAEQQATNMLYRLPHDDRREDKPSWPTKATIDEMSKMNYCVAVFTMSEDQHLHIPQGCLHAFRKMTADPLQEEDCHYDIRRKLVEEKGLGKTGSPHCVSIAFDWMFTGLEAEAINRLCAASIGCQTLGRKYDTAKPLAVPETAVLWHAKAVKSYLDGGFEGISNMDHGRRELDIKEIACGILPSLRYIVERDALDKRDLCSSLYLTIAEKADDGDTLPTEPYGVDGYRCGVCSTELAHAYFHCDGCEFSGKDFNLCTDCYIGRKYLLRPHYELCVSGPAVFGTCACREESCNMKVCTGRKPCSCSCHEKFHRRTRFYTDAGIRELVTAAERLAEGREVKYHEETLMRLRGKLMVRPGEAAAYVAKMKAAQEAAKRESQDTNDATAVEPAPQVDLTTDSKPEDAPNEASNESKVNIFAGPDPDDMQRTVTKEQQREPAAKPQQEVLVREAGNDPARLGDG